MALVALSASERQRRSRAHKKGDHSLCDPERCGDVTPPVTTVTAPDVTEAVTPEVPAGLGARGRRLYEQALGEFPQLGSRERVVLEEAARTADRCEQLDRTLRGDERVWARIQVPERDGLVLVVDKTLAEARQQQATLARLLSELRQHLAPATAGKDVPAAPPVPQTGGGALADLTARIAARRAAASSG